VIVSWRIKTDNAEPVQARLHLLGGSNFSGRASETVEVPAGPRISEFPTRISEVGVTSFGLDGGGRVLASRPGARTVIWDSPSLGGLGLEEDRIQDEDREGTELLLSVTVEPDADGDGYGDETQDACPNDPAHHEAGSCTVACALSFQAGSSDVCGPCCGEGIRPRPPRCRRGYVRRHQQGRYRCVKRRHHHPRHPSPPSSG
jgi:hypothetical protein